MKNLDLTDPLIFLKAVKQLAQYAIDNNIPITDFTIALANKGLSDQFIECVRNEVVYYPLPF